MRLFLYILFIAVLATYCLAQSKVYFETDKRPLVGVVVNGVKTSMLVDTGSSINIIDVNQLSNLGIKKRFKMSSAYSIFGKSTMWQLLEYNVSFNGLRVNQFAATDLEGIVYSIEHNTGIRIAGILGAPAIKELGLIINLKQGVITIKE